MRIIEIIEGGDSCFSAASFFLLLFARCEIFSGTPFFFLSAASCGVPARGPQARSPVLVGTPRAR